VPPEQGTYSYPRREGHQQGELDAQCISAVEGYHGVPEEGWGRVRRVSVGVSGASGVDN
jgi:hypothetical protein